MNSALRSPLRQSSSSIFHQCRPRQTFRGFKTHQTAPLQAAVSVTTPSYVVRDELNGFEPNEGKFPQTLMASPAIATPLPTSSPVAAIASRFQRRSLQLSAFALFNLGVGATLYYYISISDGQLESSFRKKNGDLDRTKFEERGNSDSSFR